VIEMLASKRLDRFLAA